MSFTRCDLGIKVPDDWRVEAWMKKSELTIKVKGKRAKFRGILRILRISMTMIEVVNLDKGEVLRG